MKPGISFEFEDFSDQALIGAFGTGALECNDGLTVYDSVELRFTGGMSISLQCVFETDEISVLAFERNGTPMENNIGSISGFERFIGKSADWCWICENYRGYKDAFILSFSSMTPDVMVLVLGSKLQVHLVC